MSNNDPIPGTRAVWSAIIADLRLAMNRPADEDAWFAANDALAEAERLLSVDPWVSPIPDAQGRPSEITDLGDDQEYEVSVRNTFDAESPEDAVRQMIEWLVDNAPSTGYRVNRAGFSDVQFIDGDDL